MRDFNLSGREDGMKIKRGFTLVEVLAATFIMALALGAFVAGINPWTNITEVVKNQGIALNAAQEQLENIINNAEVIMSFHNQTFPVEDDQGNTLLVAPSGQVNPGSITVIQVSGTTNLFDVNIDVDWQEKGGRVLSRSLGATVVQK